MQPTLSIIIPAYNEETRLPSALKDLFHFLEKQSYPSEVLVIDNASQDGTSQTVKDLSMRYPNLSLLQEPVRGKGQAVRRGMLAATGAYRFMCDADFSMPAEEISRFLPPKLLDVDVAMASREAPGAVRYGEPVHRHVIGRGFNLLIRMLALPQFHDTQCGFKCFSAQAAEFLFNRQTITGWTFDVEILYMAIQHSFRIQEVPVSWYYNPESKVRVVRDSLHMAWDLWRIRRNARRGIYLQPNGQV